MADLELTNTRRPGHINVGIRRAPNGDAVHPIDNVRCQGNSGGQATTLLLTDDGKKVVRGWDVCDEARGDKPTLTSIGSS